MILNYVYNKYKRKFEVSYIEDSGQKGLLTFNVNRFKTFYHTPTGKYRCWDDSMCDIKWTEKPSSYDIKTYLKEMKPENRAIFSKRTFPKVYTFDIETAADASGNFSEPDVADNPITTISLVSPNFNAIVMGTRPMTDDEIDSIKDNFSDYLHNTEFYRTLDVETEPTFRYVYFPTESQMLKYFLQCMSQAPIMAGWNNILYDWQYIVTRIRRYYPELSIKDASMTKSTHDRAFTTKRGDKIFLPMPDHTLIIDMMDVVDSEDNSVMPIKESLALDYIAHESMGINKIKYKGSLQDLYDSDYPRYVFYNVIDSILVQLIDKKFKCMDHIYLYSLYCDEEIGRCFSKIALTEALVFKDFYEHGLKIVNMEPVAERGRLIGAYVKKPIPGIHEFVVCNDAASLYPSCIRSCNLSFENFVGEYHNQVELDKYRFKQEFIVIGPMVYKNAGSADKPKLGDHVGTFLDEEKLAPFRNNPDYFVSVNGSVYKNDKDYAFRRIQATLKAARDRDKYMAKDIDATIISDFDRHSKGHEIDVNRPYDQKIVDEIATLGYNIRTFADILALEDQKAFITTVRKWVVYLNNNELAMKLLMNSMYGGCSHVAFSWYNMALANDITGEGRHMIHMMEHHIQDFWRENWMGMKDLHKHLGIEVDPAQAAEALETCPLVTEEMDKDAYHKKSFVYAAYGDSCTGDTRILINECCYEHEETIEDLFNRGYGLTSVRGKDFVKLDADVVNYDGSQYALNGIKHIIRHRTSKKRYKITTQRGLTVTVTEDHSCIILDENEAMKKIKPSDMAAGMKVVTCDGYGTDLITEVVCEGSFDDEYVYDIEVDTDREDMHNFFGNGILIHNTDSISGDSIIHTDSGDMTIEEFFVKNRDNGRFYTQKGHELVRTDDKVLNYSNNENLEYQGVNYIMRHKVSKMRWRIKTKSGKEITVTDDHSIIVFRDGKKLEVKPREILKTDKILVTKD